MITSELIGYWIGGFTIVYQNYYKLKRFLFLLQTTFFEKLTSHLESFLTSY